MATFSSNTGRFYQKCEENHSENGWAFQPIRKTHDKKPRAKEKEARHISGPIFTKCLSFGIEVLPKKLSYDREL